MRARFELYRVTNVISEESSRRGDYASSEASDTVTVDLREAVDALLGDYWDNLDEREDTVIAYPADYVQDYRTGDWSADQLIIRADNPANLERLMACYHAARAAERARVDAYLARVR